ncbi:MAG: ABC transporter substrate-binding protein [Caldilineaceae bacterium]
MKRLQWLLAIFVIASLALSACVAPAGQAPAASAGEGGGEQAAADDLTRPHPALSDPLVRKAIAHCIDRDALIASVYTFVEDKAALRMDSFVPKTHWAYKGPYTDYAYSPENGMALLEQAGWVDPDGDGIREKDGKALQLTLTTTNAQFRQTWAAVVEKQLAECGIVIIRQHTPASWWFGDTTGLARRDFELGAFAWVGQADPGGRTLYACDQIPTPKNNWEGQNGMGWCNEAASKAIVAANNTLDRNERIKQYDIVEKAFAEDMVSLPLFQRAEANAWSTNLEGIKTDPTEYITANANEWKMKDGKDTVVLGFTQEPASMFSLVESAAVQRQAAQLGIGVVNTQFNYDYQTVLQDGMSTLDSGLAKNETVKVKAGDTVYDVNGKPVVLEKGTKVLISGEEVEYSGDGELEMPQLTVTFKFKPYTWSDGTPGSIEDFKLGYKINCDRTSGATEFNTCDAFGTEEDTLGNITWSDSDLSYTVKYWPGVQSPTYFLSEFSITGQPIYPSHQILSDGRALKDVPAEEWSKLPEIAEKPLSFGPFMITDWQKGQSMTLEANPYYAGGTGVKKVVIVFIPDTQQAVAQLLSGDVDLLEKSTLGAGAEVQTVVDAAKEGKVNVSVEASPTWEHIDMNMFIKEK